jgi:hypothetical protein
MAAQAAFSSSIRPEFASISAAPSGNPANAAWKDVAAGSGLIEFMVIFNPAIRLLSRILAIRESQEAYGPARPGATGSVGPKILSRQQVMRDQA